jgi:LysM repeat protein
MNEQHDPNLERTIETSLTQHSSRLGSSSGRLSDVMARVERRRNRRRSVAVVGSLAAITVGVLGIASVSGRSPDQLPGAAKASTDQPSAPDATSYVITDASSNLSQAVWACQTPITYFDPQPATEYFKSCGPVGEIYEVVAGDSLASIAEMFGFAIDHVAQYNGWEDDIDIVLEPGAIVMIPREYPVPPPTIAPLECSALAVPATNPPNSDVLVSTPVPTLAPLESACSYVEDVPPTTVVECAPGTTVPNPFLGCDGEIRSTVEQSWIVEPFDSIASIADASGVSMEVLLNYNTWSANHVLLVSDVVMIPPNALLVCTSQVRQVKPNPCDSLP